ncbi:FGGY family carbohydrate kinase [Irregularibacter muris]|uniref:FGGY family carbohydrate kinase n=1 Tax=Irregularibacter muris TaxID=1796619 RepID=A0AAE3HF41_9FIRM|nr:FGGY family carbohydrate kinase [Irregularibacter muris]MCR1899395.1 FGGY family carbohydrate kinase [Irregularibacter muris]
MIGLLSIDIGTTNWKVMVFDDQGTVIASVKTPAVISMDRNSLRCYNPKIIWRNIVNLIRQIGESYSLSNIKAISVTSMGESIVPIDVNGKELCDIIPWFDVRSMDEAENIKTILGADRIFSITGLEAGAIFSLPKMLWMRKHNPEIFARTTKWLQMADYINYKLTGKIKTDFTLASRTLAFDINTNSWSTEILKALNVDVSVLPDIVASGSIMGQVTDGAASATGLLAGTPVIMGGHDHAIATISANIFDGNTILDSSGTAEPLLYVSPPNTPILMNNIGQRIGRHPDPSRYILWGGIVSSGICVEWSVERLALCKEWGYDVPAIKFNELLSSCKHIPCGSDGLLFMPYLRGSGTPHWDPRMKGAFLGLTSSHGSMHMMRAVLEGLSYQVKMIVNMHEKLSGTEIKSICCVGGGSKIALWQQIKADVTGKIIKTKNNDEATCQGAAILSSVGIGLFENLEQGAKKFAKDGEIFIPNVDNAGIYDKMYQVFTESYRDLERICYRLDRVSRKDI